jgi:hypothetical protein
MRILFQKIARWAGAVTATAAQTNAATRGVATPKVPPKRCNDADDSVLQFDGSGQTFH